MRPAARAAVLRGEEARGRSKWEPVSVGHRGWLTAYVRDPRDGVVRGVFKAQGQFQFTSLVRGRDGEAAVQVVRDRGLRKIVRAMIDVRGEELHELLLETHAERKAAVEEITSKTAPKKRRSRRKRKTRR